MTRLFIYFLLLLLLGVNSCSSQTKIPEIVNCHPINSLNKLAIQSLKSKKIVMIGDAVHGHGYYKKMVINLIWEWIESLQNNPVDTAIPQKLFLFLERDSSFMRLMNHVINSCKLDTYLTYQIDEMFKYGYWEQYSSDNFEFLFDLRKLKKKIEELNRTNKNSEIELVIVGAENKSPFNFPKILELGSEKFRKELFLWFAKERDEAVSKNIIHMLDEHKDFKAVIFYGTAHLTRDYIDKSTWAYSTEQEQIYGYFLAHYLDEYFGRRQIDVYYTTKVHGSNTNLIKEFEKDDEYIDYSASCDVLPDFAFPIYMINNIPFLKSLLTLSDKYIEGTTKADSILFVQSARMFYDHIKRSYLNFNKRWAEKIDSLAFYPLNSKSKDMKFIYKTTRRISMELIDVFDIVENIKNMDKWILMTDGFAYKTLYIAMLKSVIYNLPRKIPVEDFYNEVGKYYRTENLSQFEKDQIENRIDELKIYYAINTMWINTPEENENIIKYLERSTDLKYKTANEWNEWWRKKYSITY